MSIIVDRASVVVAREIKEEGLDGGDGCCSSSSSIGRDSDLEENEVESECKGGLDSMNALEEVLPIKRGISEFYKGKSKSFTSLADASSIKDFAKPENPYTRKRKSLLAHRCVWDRKACHPPVDGRDGIAKKTANFCRNVLPVGLTASFPFNTNTEDNQFIPSLPSYCLPPLHPKGCGKKRPVSALGSPCPQQNSPCRSFSLSDLHCAAVTTSNS